MRKCRGCGRRKRLAAFPSYYKGQAGPYYRHLCRPCYNHDNNIRAKARACSLTPAEVEQLLSKRSACPICGYKDPNMALDHCHETGRLRDVICRSCNLGLGHFLDNPRILRAAADYVERHRAH